mmetsp:Transcript_925/g.1622  ORF Transcript_925/g.1622 Transcript_925/m.1622 type:complete len:354 (-) Transcript_925:178-1239(-)
MQPVSPSLQLADTSAAAAPSSAEPSTHSVESDRKAEQAGAHNRHSGDSSASFSPSGILSPFASPVSVDGQRVAVTPHAASKAVEHAEQCAESAAPALSPNAADPQSLFTTSIHDGVQKAPLEVHVVVAPSLASLAARMELRVRRAGSNWPRSSPKHCESFSRSRQSRGPGVRVQKPPRSASLVSSFAPQDRPSSTRVVHSGVQRFSAVQSTRNDEAHAAPNASCASVASHVLMASRTSAAVPSFGFPPQVARGCRQAGEQRKSGLGKVMEPTTLSSPDVGGASWELIPSASHGVSSAVSLQSTAPLSGPGRTTGCALASGANHSATDSSKAPTVARRRLYITATILRPHLLRL